MPQPTTNNLEGWEEEFENTYPYFPQPQKDVVINFMRKTRKNDMAELIKALGSSMALTRNVREKIIRDYYNK